MIDQDWPTGEQHEHTDTTLPGNSDTADSNFVATQVQPFLTLIRVKLRRKLQLNFNLEIYFVRMNELRIGCSVSVGGLGFEFPPKKFLYRLIRPRSVENRWSQFLKSGIFEVFFDKKKLVKRELSLCLDCSVMLLFCSELAAVVVNALFCSTHRSETDYFKKE